MLPHKPVLRQIWKKYTRYWEKAMDADGGVFEDVFESLWGCDERPGPVCPQFGARHIAAFPSSLCEVLREGEVRSKKCSSHVIASNFSEWLRGSLVGLNH